MQFTALIRSGLIKDMLCAFSEERNTFWAFAELGENVCGHPRTTHGGMTAALIDDTLGGLSFMLKQNRNKKKKAPGGPVAPAGPAFTVQLEISYKKIVPAGSAVVVEATIESIEGRKMWLTARVLSGGILGEEVAVEHARARALFVVPRDWKPPPPTASGDEGLFSAAAATDMKETTAGATAAAPPISPRGRAHSIEDDVLTEAGVERLALAAAAAAAAAKEEELEKKAGS